MYPCRGHKTPISYLLSFQIEINRQNDESYMNIVEEFNKTYNKHIVSGDTSD